MKNEFKPRVISAVCVGIIFSVIPALVKTTETAFVEARIANEIHKYSTVDLIEYLELSLSVEFVDNDSFQVTFRRDTSGKFDIPGMQTQQVSAFCDGFPKLMRKREPISIAMDEGKRDIGLNYRIDEWGIDRVRKILEPGCTMTITRMYELTLPHNVKRTVELKATTKFPDGLVAPLQ